MNLESIPLRELIEHASNNDYDVVIRTTYCLIRFLDDSGYVSFFETCGGICIFQSTYYSDQNPVKLSVDDFKSMFVLKV